MEVFDLLQVRPLHHKFSSSNATSLLPPPLPVRPQHFSTRFSTEERALLKGKPGHFDQKQYGRTARRNELVTFDQLNYS